MATFQIFNLPVANRPILKRIQNFDNLIWGCFGFDRMFGLIKLRVRALFPIINEQNKLNATDNVVVADFSRAAARRAA